MRRPGPRLAIVASMRPIAGLQWASTWPDPVPDHPRPARRVAWADVLIKDIAKKHGLDIAAFDRWLKQAGYRCTSGLTGLKVDDCLNPSALAREFKQHSEAERERVAKGAADAERAAQEKQRALASMLITSGFSFDGYTTTEYSGSFCPNGAPTL